MKLEKITAVYSRIISNQWGKVLLVILGWWLWPVMLAWWIRNKVFKINLPILFKRIIVFPILFVAILFNTIWIVALNSDTESEIHSSGQVVNKNVNKNVEIKADESVTPTITEQLVRITTVEADTNQKPKTTEFIVSRVIDGDTIELNNGQKVRYIGIDTQESVHPNKPIECFSKEASEENRRLVAGKTIRLEKDVSETDRYGRLLRYVYVDDVFVNEYLVRQGYAYASSYPPDIKYQSRLRDAQQEALNSNRGLWSACNNNASSVIRPIVTTAPASLINNGVCNIKGNISVSSEEKIYHVPGQRDYDKTQINEGKGERWFCSETDAVNAGWRKAKR